MDLQKIRGITEALSNEIVNLEQFTSNLELKQIELTDKENSLNAREKSLVNRESVLLNKKSSIELRDKDITRNETDLKHKQEKIGIISGVRKFESKRRGRTAKPILKDGSMIFVAPIFYLKTEEVWSYIKENNLEVSPVYKTLHLSGDCMCGAFSEMGEAELISLFYPEIAKRIEELEIKYCKIKYCKWGNQSSMSGAIKQKRMDNFICADCQISNKQ